MKGLLLGVLDRGDDATAVWRRIAQHVGGRAALSIQVRRFPDEDAQCEALLKGAVDVAWNTSVAHAHCRNASGHGCRALVQREADAGLAQVVLGLRGGTVNDLADVAGKTLAVVEARQGPRALLTFHLLAALGLREESDFTPLWLAPGASPSDDTEAADLEVLKAMLGGRAEAGLVDHRFWDVIVAGRRVPKGAFDVVWTTPSHSGFTLDARPGLDREVADALSQAFCEAPTDDVDPGGGRASVRWILSDERGYDALCAALEASPAPAFEGAVA